MKIDQALIGVHMLGMDTSPFIYLVEKHPKYLSCILSVFEQVRIGAVQAMTSTLTITQVLTMPFVKNQTQYVDEYREMLLNTEFITSITADSIIAEQAAALRAKYGLKTPDALQIATALETGCHAFLTNDMGLKRVSEIRVLVLDELEVS